MQASVCERCDWLYLVPASRPLANCPHCGAATPAALSEELEALPTVRPPEFAIPFALTPEALSRGVEAFAADIPFPPPGLNAEALQSRLRPIYLPTWLVDADVEALWEAEVGFNYQVVSHEEHYDDRRHGWVTREVEEGRIRWEPRVGQLHRTYHNVPAPALEEHAALRERLGEWDLADLEPYRPSHVTDAAVALPDRTPEGAWPAALPTVRRRAAEECQEAADADHLRQFRWRPEFLSRDWTLLLRPVYATTYEDDKGHPRVLLIHGRTGRVDGARRASMARAQPRALIIGALALVMFVASLAFAAAGLLVPPLLIVGGLGGLAALLTGAGALVPIARVWQFNRQQDAAEGS
jgi:hypothetical protein